MLKQNGYQESIITTISKRVTNNHSLLQSQQKKNPQLFKRKRSE